MADLKSRNQWGARSNTRPWVAAKARTRRVALANLAPLPPALGDLERCLFGPSRSGPASERATTQPGPGPCWAPLNLRRPAHCLELPTNSTSSSATLLLVAQVQACFVRSLSAVPPRSAAHTQTLSSRSSISRPEAPIHSIPRCTRRSSFVPRASPGSFFTLVFC